MQHTNHIFLTEPHDGGFREGGCAGRAHGLTGQAFFAKEVAGAQNGDDRGFALTGDGGELDLAFLDVKDGVPASPWEKIPRFLG
jgi:hypothetical protein